MENQKKIKAKRWASKTAKLLAMVVGFQVFFAVMGGNVNRIAGSVVSVIWIGVGWGIAYVLGYLTGEE